MSKGIRVSQKHGINPSIQVCFWCRKEKGEIALLGKLPGDKEAPRHVVIDYEFCDECVENIGEGVALIHVTQTPNPGQPPIQDGLYPTGKWVAMRAEPAKEIFPSLGDSKVALLDGEVWKQLGLE